MLILPGGLNRTRVSKNPIDEMSKRLKTLNESVAFRPPTDVSTQLGELARRRAEIQNGAPSAGDYEVLKLQQLTTESDARQRLLRALQVPTMGSTRNIPMPTREDVPLPSEYTNRNERAAKIAGGLLGFFGRGGDGAVQSLIDRAILKDEKDYGRAREDYQVRLAKADRGYNDALEGRRQALDLAREENTASYNAAMIRYGQEKDVIDNEARSVGSKAYLTGLEQLNTKARTSQEGLANLERDITVLQAKAQHDKDSNTAWREVNVLFMEAEKLKQAGDIAESDRLVKSAQVKLYESQLLNSKMEREQKSTLFPLERRQLEKNIDLMDTTKRVNEASIRAKEAESRESNARVANLGASTEYIKAQAKALGKETLSKERIGYVRLETQPFADAYNFINREVLAKEKSLTELETQLAPEMARDDDHPNKISAVKMLESARKDFGLLVEKQAKSKQEYIDATDRSIQKHSGKVQQKPKSGAIKIKGL